MPGTWYLVRGSGKDSSESSKALGIEEPECVYVYVHPGEFGANSL